MIVFKFRQENRDIFEAIKSGTKKIETRAATAKYKDINVGDIVKFSCGSDSFEKRAAKVAILLVDSKGNVLIQMADMIAGSIRRFYDPAKTDAKIYKSIVKKHIEDEWKFK